MILILNDGTGCRLLLKANRGGAIDLCVDFVSLRFANVVLTHSRSLDGVQHTHFVILSNKISNKVVAVVCRRFKTNDEAVLV